MTNTTDGNSNLQSSNSTFNSNEFMSTNQHQHQHISSFSNYFPFKYNKYKKAKLRRNKTDNENVYFFNESDEDDDSKDSFILKNRNDSSSCSIQKEKIEYLIYEIKPTDTIQSVALKFNCSISSIKRCNNLISDQEFHGLKHVKLPMKKHGILTEALYQQSNVNSTDDLTNSNPITVNLGIRQHIEDNRQNDVTKFLSEMDKDLQRICQSTKSVIESSNINKSNEDFSGYKIVTKTKRKVCDETDYGINLPTLLIIAFIICFLIPVIYIIYFSETKQ